MLLWTISKKRLIKKISNELQNDQVVLVVHMKDQMKYELV